MRTPQQAFVQMATDVATALDIDGENMVPARWAQWIKLPVRENDDFVRTPSGPVRIPHVIVPSRFAKLPKRRPKFSARAIWARDGGAASTPDIPFGYQMATSTTSCPARAAARLRGRIASWPARR